jgi:biofilm PGA synthesis N-glycosyltransferase PgaC
METLSILEICAAIMILLGFLSLAIPIYSFKINHTKSEEKQPRKEFSIVTACRNEQLNLPDLYQSLCDLNYPQNLFEWVVCNDHSDDDSKNWILTIQKSAPFSIVYCENTTETGKKAALNTAVNHAAFETIFFTDADCNLPPDLLKTLDNHLAYSNDLLIAGPIKYKANHSFLYQYQCMESAVLMALTARSFKSKKSLMANGANLCVNKTLFLEAQETRVDWHIPGGDDIFLLEYAIQKNPEACVFLGTDKNTIETLAEKNWSALLNQRTRWASKVRFQKNISGKIWQLFSVIFALYYLLSMALMPLFGWHVAGIMVIGKWLADMVLMSRILPQFHYRANVLQLAAYSICQVLMIIYAGVRSVAGHYYWKGRKH